MADKKEMKSYMADMQMEIVTDDDRRVKAIRIHGFHHEQIPVYLWCDLMQRFGQMTPGEDVVFVQSGNRIDGEPVKTACEPGRLYACIEDFDEFIKGDYFFGLEGGDWLQHVRSGYRTPYNRHTKHRFFDTGQTYDPDVFARHDAELERFMEKMKTMED